MRASILCFGALGALGVVGAVAGLGGCSGTSEPAPGSSSGSGSGAAALPRPGASPVSADEAVKIRHYLDARYRPSDVRHSFRTSLGQDIDCIDFFAQPGVRALAAQGHPITSIPAVPDLPANVRPSEPSGEEVEQGVAFDGSLDVAGSARACPVGTVPQVRLTVEQVQHAGGLEAFRKALHAKSAPPKVIRRPDEYGSCGGDYPGYAHVVGSLLTPFTDPIVAGASVMSIYGPTIPDAAVDYGHSIAQTWMAGYSADYRDLQTVETGWNVDNWVYGDDTNVPHLFIFATTDNYVTTGCYNDWDSAITGYEYDDAGNVELDDAGNPVPGTCVPWVQFSRTYTPGMALPPSAVKAVNPHRASTLPRELSLTTVKLAGNWWIVVQVSGKLPELLGYYSGKSIDFTMSSYQVGGEVASGTGVFAGTGIMMGSGQAPSGGQGLAAYHRDYFALVDGPTESGSPLVGDAFVCATDPTEYTYSATPKPVSRAQGPWASYFYFGGDPPAATASTP